MFEPLSNIPGPHIILQQLKKNATLQRSISQHAQKTLYIFHKLVLSSVQIGKRVYNVEHLEQLFRSASFSDEFKQAMQCETNLNKNQTTKFKFKKENLLFQDNLFGGRPRANRLTACQT